MEYENVFTNDTATDYVPEVLFRNLAPDVEYTFEIAANNKIGAGPVKTTNYKTLPARKLFSNILINSPF